MKNNYRFEMHPDKVAKNSHGRCPRQPLSTQRCDMLKCTHLTKAIIEKHLFSL